MGTSSFHSRGRRPMGEAVFPSMALPPSAFQKPSASSLRLLGLLKQPDPDPDPSPLHHLELDESDVVWCSASNDLSPSTSPSTSPSAVAHDDHDSVDGVSSPSPNLVRSPLAASSSSRSPSPHIPRPFTPERWGLSAALVEDRLPLVCQRRLATAAARATRPVAVPVGRAEVASMVGRVGRHQSAPVKVPAWPKWRKGRKTDGLGGVEEEGGWEDAKEDEEEEEEIVPPHLIVARSHVRTFSVFEGVGRTLKGRDLRRVRNAVLQKTGFLDM